MTSRKTVLITGATAGIGRFVALHLARRGHRVIATGRRTDALETLKQEAVNRDVDTVVLDVTRAESIERARLAVLTLTEGRGVDGLVNNAGYGQAGPIELITDEELRAQFETNVFGLMAVTRAFLPEMRTRGDGRIVNISSVAGRLTMPLFGAYNASKYAVESLSDALRMELHHVGIRVSLVEPGLIRSEFAQRFLDSGARFLQPDSPYARVWETAGKMQALLERFYVGPEGVACDIEHALTSRNPRARYVYPRTTALLLALKAVTPTALWDEVSRQLAGLTEDRLRPARERAPAVSTESRFNIQ